MSIGIYKITSPSDKTYIGQSINIERRWKAYKNINESKSQIKLYSSFIKYGIINHKFEIIEKCSIEQLNEKEIYWGLYYCVLDKTGLNLKLGNSNGKCSQETKDKISQARKGWVPSIERGIKIGNKNKNRILSDEHKNKIGKSNSKPKPMFIGRISPNKGLKHTLTEEQKLKQKNKNGKKVNQYDIQGNFIQEWKSCSAAAFSLNKSPSLISQCCREKVKTAFGFIWKY